MMASVSDRLRGLLGLPASQTGEFRGLEFRVDPAFWLRRLLHFPFFFESTHPSFHLHLTRKTIPLPESQGVWVGNKIEINIRLANGQMANREFDLPDLQVGESTTLMLEGVYSPWPGQTMIILPVIKPDSGRGHEQILYSYHVRSEEQLWAWGIGPVFGVAVVILGAAVQKWLGLL